MQIVCFVKVTHRWSHRRDLEYKGYEVRTQNKSFVTFMLIVFSLRFNRAYCTRGASHKRRVQ